MAKCQYRIFTTECGPEYTEFIKNAEGRRMRPGQVSNWLKHFFAPDELFFKDCPDWGSKNSFQYSS